VPESRPDGAEFMNSRQSVEILLSSRRILVLGPCGSGKTWLTRQLSQILNLPAVHLDANFWQPGWISTPQPEWRVKVSTLVKEESWIMDGTYESTLDLRIPAAEVIIMTRCPRWASFWGVIRRSMIYRNMPRPDAPLKQPVDLAYMRYIWKYPGKTEPLVNKLIAKHSQDIPTIQLNSRRSIESLISVLQDKTNRLLEQIDME
jgi:adenylate kinase family enzyme